MPRCSETLALKSPKVFCRTSLLQGTIPLVGAFRHGAARRLRVLALSGHRPESPILGQSGQGTGTVSQDRFSLLFGQHERLRTGSFSKSVSSSPVFLVALGPDPEVFDSLLVPPSSSHSEGAS